MRPKRIPKNSDKYTARNLLIENAVDAVNAFVSGPGNKVHFSERVLKGKMPLIILSQELYIGKISAQVWIAGYSEKPMKHFNETVIVKRPDGTKKKVYRQYIYRIFTIGIKFSGAYKGSATKTLKKMSWIDTPIK